MRLNRPGFLEAERHEARFITGASMANQEEFTKWLQDVSVPDAGILVIYLPDQLPSSDEHIISRWKIESATSLKQTACSIFEDTKAHALVLGNKPLYAVRVYRKDCEHHSRECLLRFSTSAISEANALIASVFKTSVNAFEAALDSNDKTIALLEEKLNSIANDTDAKAFKTFFLETISEGQLQAIVDVLDHNQGHTFRCLLEK